MCLAKVTASSSALHKLHDAGIAKGRRRSPIVNALLCSKCQTFQPRDRFSLGELRRAQKWCQRCEDGSPIPRRPHLPAPRMARLETDADGRSYVRIYKPLQKFPRPTKPLLGASVQGPSVMSMSVDDTSAQTPSPSSPFHSSSSSDDGHTPTSQESESDTSAGWTTWVDAPGNSSASEAWDDSDRGDDAPFMPDAGVVRDLHRAMVEQATTGDPYAGDDVHALITRIGMDAAFSKAAPISPGRILCRTPVEIVATTQTVQHNITREFVFDFFRRWCDSPDKAHEAADVFWRASHPRALQLSLPDAPHVPAIVPGRIPMSTAQRAAVWRKKFGDSKTGACPQCRQTMRYERGQWTVAHLKAVGRGGSTTPDGVTISCSACNTALGAAEAPVSWHAT